MPRKLVAFGVLIALSGSPISSRAADKALQMADSIAWLKKQLKEGVYHNGRNLKDSKTCDLIVTYFPLKGATEHNGIGIEVEQSVMNIVDAPDYQPKDFRADIADSNLAVQARYGSGLSACSDSTHVPTWLNHGEVALEVQRNQASNTVTVTLRDYEKNCISTSSTTTSCKFKEVPANPNADPDAHVSIGSEYRDGIPTDVIVALPEVFPDLLPKNKPGRAYEKFGMVYTNPGDELPAGFSERKTFGIGRVAMNCFLCHTSTYRVSDAAERQIIVGGGSSTLDLQAYLRFLFTTSTDPRFTDGTLLKKIVEMRAAKHQDLSFVKQQLYKLLLVPVSAKALQFLKTMFAWAEERPNWGRGRIDPFNPVKFSPFMLKMDTKTDHTIGNSKMIPLWLANDRYQNYHWDGLNTDLKEVVYSSALGDGSLKFLMPEKKLDDLQAWSLSLGDRAPRYPGEINTQLAATGKTVFENQCAVCHASTGARYHQVIPQTEVGTDEHRLQMWTPQAATAYNRYTQGKDYAFSHFRSSNGYVAVDLKSIWLRGPYLHNGSVPSIAALLTPPEQRPLTFCHGYDVLDTQDLGFVSQGEAACTQGDPYQVNIEGNSARGHRYGVDLPPEDKHALIEYLKTL